MMAAHTTGQSLGDAIQLHGKKQQQRPHCCTILVTDTIEADGRFILCHLAAVAAQMQQQLPTKSSSTAGGGPSSSSSRVLWFACGGGGGTDTSTVRAAIRRLGSAAGSAETVSVQSVPAMILDEQILMGQDRNDDDVDHDEDAISDKRLQPLWEQLLSMIQDWRQQVTVSDDSLYPLVIIDDMSTLAVLMGEREAYLLAYWARDLSLEVDFHLVIRSLGTDGTSFQTPIAYFGAGGKQDTYTTVDDDDDEAYCWEAGLVELADQIIDVRPLASGYSREAQGRFFITDKQQEKKRRLLYNYLLLDNDVRVFRKD
jgi:hypothetical protein